jgi:hypothetical protein
MTAWTGRRKGARAAVAAVALVAIATSGLSTIASSAASAAAPQWSVMDTPSPAGPGNTQLNDVSCLTTSYCIAVGDYDGPGRFPAFASAELWNGFTWSLLPSANIGSTLNRLMSVSCVSTQMCIAVGYTASGSGAPPYATLIERWNGTQWSMLPSPNPNSSNALLGVTCTSATSCVAVGYSDTTTSLVEMWDGASWTSVTSPSVGQLNDVSCSSASSCVAVGSTPSLTPISESWDGTAWTDVPVPIPTDFGLLLGVSCLSATDCTAVGESHTSDLYHLDTLVETWNGSVWSAVASPNPGTIAGVFENQLRRVACTSANNCVAVGYNSDSTSQSTIELVETWDGSSWTVTPSPGVLYGLAGVSCVSAASCVGVGMGRYGNLITSVGIPVLATPGAPTHVAVVPGNGAATLTWHAPTNTGNPPLGGYVVVPVLAGVVQPRRTFASTKTGAVISGLKNGKRYTFRVAGVSAVGVGSFSPTSLAIFVGTPTAPAIKKAVAGHATATLTWTAPNANGAAIKSYIVTQYRGARAVGAITFNSPATIGKISRLKTGSTYTFKVAAKNARGTGTASLMSKPVKVS